MRIRPSAILPLAFLSSLVVAQPVSATEGMVAASEPLATSAGVKILRLGGNAFDAAVAVGFALAVTYPEAGNIGGGGFMVGLTSHGTPLALDFRETAPKAATKNMFLDDSGDLVPGRSLDSYLSTGVPGTVDGLVELQRKFGKLTLEQDMAPAVSLALGGFKVSADLHRALVADKERLSKIGTTAVIFYPNGEPLAEGESLIQRDLGHTLEAISDKGRAGFYEGPVAANIASIMEIEGGLVSQDDLRSYHSKWRSAFKVRFGTYELITMPPPSSGGVTIAEILGMSDASSLKSAGLNSSSYVQQVVEAERLAYADRNEYLGDPDFEKIPIAELTSRDYLERRAKLMPKGRAGSSKDVTPGPAERPQTTHYCVVDKDGNVASVSYTLNGSFGMGAVVPGAGFLLNNEMDDFTSKIGAPNQFGLIQGAANAIEPRKRMLSSMTPTVAMKDGHFFATFGSPGGSTIITTVLQVFLDIALFDKNVRDAVDAPRFHHQEWPDAILAEEDAFSMDVHDSLTSMGYKITTVRGLGLVNAIMKMPDGTLQGWSDRRGAGNAAGY